MVVPDFPQEKIKRFEIEAYKRPRSSKDLRKNPCVLFGVASEASVRSQKGDPHHGSLQSQDVLL